MTALATGIDPGPLGFSRDYVGVDYHSDTHSHIDALCHVAYRGALYNGTPADAVTAQGATVEAIDVLRNGLVGRGVLLDVPRLRGVRWLEPGEHIFREDLEAAEREQGVGVGPGDILMVRTGHARTPRRAGALGRGRRQGRPAPDRHDLRRRAGASPRWAATATATPRPAPPRASTSRSTSLAINAMGVHLLDYLQFEDLRPPASGPAAGSSSSPPRRCASPAAPARRSTRPPSSDRGRASFRCSRPGAVLAAAGDSSVEVRFHLDLAALDRLGEQA